MKTLYKISMSSISQRLCEEKPSAGKKEAAYAEADEILYRSFSRALPDTGQLEAGTRL